MKIYTKTGDKGETGLIGGARVKKNHDRLNVYGNIDELNSFIGLLLSFWNLDSTDFQKDILIKIQGELFKLGALFACDSENWQKYHLENLNTEIVLEMEKAIDFMETALIPLKNFILPGGSQCASLAHICRSECRKVERLAVEFSLQYPQHMPVGSDIFLNRLSDYFFVLARYLNKKSNTDEVIWKGR